MGLGNRIGFAYTKDGDRIELSRAGEEYELNIYYGTCQILRHKVKNENIAKALFNYIACEDQSWPPRLRWAGANKEDW